MALPRKQELYNPILDYLKEHGLSPLSSIRDDLADYFLIPHDEAYDRDNGYYSLYESRVNYACWDLWHAGLIVRVHQGLYALTDEGEKELDDDLDRKHLWDIPEFREYELSRRKKDSEPDTIILDDDRKHFLPRPEYVPVEKPSLIQIAAAAKCDARFANMLASGCYMYEDGCIREVPLAVLQHDMSYQEFKASADGQIMDSGKVEICQDANGSGKTIARPKIRKEPYIQWNRKKPKWDNPHPYVSDNHTDNYNTAQEMIDFINNSHGDFNECFKHLVDDVYNVSAQYLADSTGIDVSKIHRMRKNPNVSKSVKVEELTAIMLVLQASSYILEAFISLIGLDSRSIKYRPYTLICDTMRYATYEEVNDVCDNEKVTKVFPGNLSGEISKP